AGWPVGRNVSDGRPDLFPVLLRRLPTGQASAKPSRLRSTGMIEISHVSKSYGSFQVLKDCNASVSRGEVVVICGPSGSGKSTLIKTVNGLEPIDSGETHMAALRRSVGMVFQSFELFPHLTVLSNVTIAQVKVLKRPKAVADEKA